MYLQLSLFVSFLVWIGGIPIKRFFSFFLCVLFVCVLCVNSFAEEVSSDDGGSDLLQSKEVTESVEEPTALYTASSVSSSDSDNVGSTFEEMSVLSYNVTSSNTNGLKSVMLSLIGDYETVVTDYTYSTGSSYTQHSIEIEQDNVWICSFFMFALVVYCLFRLGGAFIGWYERFYFMVP